MIKHLLSMHKFVALAAATAMCLTASAYDITVTGVNGQKFTAGVDDVKSVTFDTPAQAVSFTGAFTNEITTGVGAHDVNVPFDASMYWIISEKDETATWMRLSKNYGNAGENMITISLDANKLQAPRTATFTMLCGFRPIVFTVVQTPDMSGQYVDMPDAKFNEYILNNYDEDGDGQLSAAEAAKIKYLNVKGLGIETLAGIRQMPNLETLDCSGNVIDNTLDLSGLTKLRVVNAHHNQYNKLVMNGCTALEELYANDNYTRVNYRNIFHLESVELQGCTSLRIAQLEDNIIFDLDLSDCTALTDLMLAVNQLPSIDLSNCRSLVHAHLRSNPMKDVTLDLSGCPELATIDIAENDMAGIDVSGCPKLEELRARYNKLTTIDVTKNPKLRVLELFSNQLSALDVTKNPELNNLWAGSNQLTALDVTKNAELQSLNVSGNKIEGALDLTANNALNTIEVSNNLISELKLPDTSVLEQLNANNNKLTSLDLSHAPELLAVVANNNQLESINLAGCENTTVVSLDNNKLTSVDLSDMLSLRMLDINGNKLEAIDLTVCPALEEAHIANNVIADAKLTDMLQLTTLEIYGNRLTSIDLTGTIYLDELHIHNNLITEFTPSQDPALRYVDLRNNQITSVDFSSNDALQFAFGTSNPCKTVWLSEIAPNNQIEFDEGCEIKYGKPGEQEPEPEPVAAGYNKITSMSSVTLEDGSKYLLVCEGANGLFAERQTTNFHTAYTTTITDGNIAADADNTEACQLTIGKDGDREMYWLKGNLARGGKECYIECMNNFGGSPAKIGLYGTSEEEGSDVWLWGMAFDADGNVQLTAHPKTTNDEFDMPFTPGGALLLGYCKSKGCFAIYDSSDSSDYYPVQLYKLSN